MRSRMPLGVECRRLFLLLTRVVAGVQRNIGEVFQDQSLVVNRSTFQLEERVVKHIGDVESLLGVLGEQSLDQVAGIRAEALGELEFASFDPN